jgi:hypothetical protein
MRPSVGIGVLVCASTIVLSGIVAGSGCTVLTNDSLPDDAGKFDGTTDGAVPVCATCLSQECAGQWATCFDDPACIALAKRASSATCAVPDGGNTDGGVNPLALYGAFTACNGVATANGAACAADCTGASQPSACVVDGGLADSGASDAGDAGDDGATNADAGDDAGDGGVSDAGANDAADAGTATPVNPVVVCTSCVNSECGDPKKACAIGTECAAYLECTFAAADAAAAEECGRQHATGKTAAAELATCTRVGCSNACGF